MLYFELRNKLGLVIGTKSYERFDEAVNAAKLTPEVYAVAQMIIQYGEASFLGNAWTKKAVA